MFYICGNIPNFGADFGFDGVQGWHVSMQGQVTIPLTKVTKL